jgi:hypothetical protein
LGIWHGSLIVDPQTNLTNIGHAYGIFMNSLDIPEHIDPLSPEIFQFQKVPLGA